MPTAHAEMINASKHQSESKRLPERPRYGWENNTSLDRNKIWSESVNWINFIRNRG
jgi:hypothetical protein